MPVAQLDPSVQLDSAKPGVVELPKETRLDPPRRPPPETSLGGLAGSVTRGLAPMATGALAGAALGAPAGGVGAVPGAALGAGAMGLTELATTLYRPLSEHFGWPKVATPQEMTDRILGALRVREPSTPTERTVKATTAGAAGALGPARAAEEAATMLTGPVSRRVAASMAERPVTQAISGAAGGAAAQTAAEAGLGPKGQAVAGLIGGGVPYTPQALRAAISAEPRQVALEARQAGYVLPPAQFSGRPGVVSSALAGWGGKIKTYQGASERNQEVTNALAARSLGLAPNTVLSHPVFEHVRDQAGQTWQDVTAATRLINADPDYVRDVMGLGGTMSQTAQIFPRTSRNPAITTLRNELLSVPQLPTRAALDKVKELRFEAGANLKGRDDPKKWALGLTQRGAADAIDNLIERNLTALGNPDLVDRYRQARRLIARSYDVEGATNFATGDVNARGLSRLAAKGRPLTGDLDTIARVGAAFPKATMPPAGFGHDENFSALDFFGGVGAAISGHPEVAGIILGRPVARATVLSRPYQNVMAGPGADAGGTLPLVMQPGMWGVTDPRESMRRAAQPVPQQP